MTDPFYIRRTDKSIEQLMTDLQTAVEEVQFSIVHIHDMQQKYSSVGQQTGIARVIEVCNPEKSFKAFSMSPKLLSMMPKAIDIYEENGQLQVMFMRADKDKLGELFPGTPIREMSGKVADTLKAIVDKAVS